MTERIQPIAKIQFRKLETEVIEYKGNKLYVHKTPVKCLKVIDNRFKIHVDYGFKGNSRYADDQSDYYVIDMKKDDALLLPSSNDYGSIVATLEEQADKERPITNYVSDTKVMVLTMTHLVHDGWLFTQEANGDIVALQPDDGEKKRFADDDKLKQWVLSKSLDY